MRFKLRIPGRDDFQGAPAANSANSANPLIVIESSANLPTSAASTASDHDPVVEPISRLAGLAGHDVLNAEVIRFDKRVSRISLLGYGDDADHLGVLLLRRDRDMDERRLCVEYIHAGPGWRCGKRDAFLVRQLQRCDNFMGVN